jgi:hypothetical protein
MECNIDVIKDIIIVIVCIYKVETLDVLNMSKGKPTWNALKMSENISIECNKYVMQEKLALNVINTSCNFFSIECNRYVM